MEIYLSDDLKITGEPLNYVLEETYFNKNKETKEIKIKWRTIGYYPTYELLIKRLLEKELRQSNINSLLEIENVLNKLTNEIITYLKKVN